MHELSQENGKKKKFNEERFIQKKVEKKDKENKILWS